MSDDYRYPLSLMSLPVLNGAAPAASPSPSSAAANLPESAPVSANATADPIEQKLLEGKIIEALSEVFDPEIPVNIYELGLIYEIKIHPDRRASIKMTLTAPACPVAGSLPGEVERKVESIPEITSADVELVWEPAWSRDRMSEAALLTLGML